MLDVYGEFLSSLGYKERHYRSESADGIVVAKLQIFRDWRAVMTLSVMGQVVTQSIISGNSEADLLQIAEDRLRDDAQSISSALLNFASRF